MTGGDLRERSIVIIRWDEKAGLRRDAAQREAFGGMPPQLGVSTNSFPIESNPGCLSVNVNEVRAARVFPALALPEVCERACRMSRNRPHSGLD
jgi:hypothetical protein